MWGVFGVAAFGSLGANPRRLGGGGGSPTLFWGHFGVFLGQFLTSVGRSGVLGAIWGHSDPFWGGYLGGVSVPSEAVSWALLGPPEAFWGRFGTGTLFGVFWVAPIGAFWGHLRLFGGHFLSLILFGVFSLFLFAPFRAL